MSRLDEDRGPFVTTRPADAGCTACHHRPARGFRLGAQDGPAVVIHLCVRCSDDIAALNESDLRRAKARKPRRKAVG